VRTFTSSSHSCLAHEKPPAQKGQWLVLILIQVQGAVSVFEQMMAERQHHRNELAKLITKRLKHFADLCETVPPTDEAIQTNPSKSVTETASCRR